MRRNKYIACVLFLLIGINFACLAQDEPSSQTEEAIRQPQTASSKLVTAIEIRGNKAISTNVVISKMKTRIGAPYQENVISDDLKRLYLMGFFSDIKINTESYKNGIKIIITVEERPLIDRITFSGMLHLTTREEKLKESLKSKETQYLDYPNLAEDVQTLKKMYEKIGFSEAKIDYEVILDKQTHKAKVQFNITEGRRIRVKNIFVMGNSSFPARRILGLIKTKRAWFFNAGILKDEVFKEDLERVKAFYRREGYTDVEVDSEIKQDPKRPFLYITLKVKEGKKYLFGNITIKGNLDIPEKAILEKLQESMPGKVFNQEAVKRDMTNIQSLYFDRGYITCQIDEATSLNPDTGRVDVVYNIIENEIAYVDKVKIRGNVKTKDVVIRRELKIKPGDKFDGEKLRRSKEKLTNLGFFEEISYDTEDTEDAAKKDLVVEVKETKTGAFSFGGGYSTVDKLVGFIEVEQKNFDWKNFPYFTGAGQDLKVRASLGSVSNSYDLSFTEPWVFDYPVSFGFDAYKRVQKRETDIGYGYDQDVRGGDLRLGKILTDDLRADATYRYETIKISNVSGESTNDLKKEEGKNNISSIAFGLTYDTRDNIFDTRKGDVLFGSINWAGGPLSGDKDFWKFYGQASHFFPLFRGSALEIRGRVGLAKPYGDSNDLPIYERYFAGGAYTVRGYNERKVGPIDPVSKDPLGGNAMFIGNIEYTYPIFDFLKAAAFYDVGNVWEKISNFGTGNLKSGIGVGVRLKTPIGPMMLDYGIPLSKEPGEEKKGEGKVHFSVSQGF